MRDVYKRIKSFYFLYKRKVRQESNVYIERPENIELGSNISIKYKSRIRSRSHNSIIKIGNDVKIRESVEINAKGRLVDIGDFCFIAKNCWIGGSGCVKVGSNSMIGIGAILVASDHDYNNIAKPYYSNSEIPKNITIGENVWIGAGVVVLGETNIGNGSVVSAGAVVKGNYPKNSLIVGIPAIVKATITRNCVE